MRSDPGPRLPRRPPSSLNRFASSGRGRPLHVAAGAVAILGLLWVLLLPPFSVLRGDGWTDAGEDSLVRQRKDVPKAPNGLQFASPYYEIRSKHDEGIGPVQLTVPLGEGKVGRGLALYTWTGEKWQRLGPAEVSADGLTAKGQTDRLPANVVVMRRIDGGFVFQGILAQGAALHPDAEKLITVRSSLDYVPMPDGSVSGASTPGTPGDEVARVPVVRAVSGAEAQAVNAILSSEAARTAHVEALARLVQQHKLDGLDLEYTAIEPGMGGAFTQFVAALAERLHRTGQTLTVTAPLPRREANNWNSFGYDWKDLAKHADYLRILPERDQSIYRRTMREALNFLTGQVDPKKLILTVSPLASEKSEQGVRTLSALEALSLAAQITVRDRDRLFAGGDAVFIADNLNRDGGAVGPIWDATAAAVSFAYPSPEGLRTVWIENLFSTAFKLEFVQLWGLGGIAVDDAADGQGAANIWPAIRQFQESGGQPLLLQPNSSLLRPQWLVDGKSAEIGKAVFTWRGGEPGEHTIALIVGDGVMRVMSQTKVTLRPGPPPAPAPVPAAASSPSPTPARR